MGGIECGRVAVMAVGDIIQIVLRGTNQGETWLNAFYYRQQDTATETYLSGVASEFENVVIDALASFAPPAITFDQVNLRNIFDGNELVVIPSVTTGARTIPGEMCASFIAAHCKLVRGNNRVRHGHKYVVGAYEGDVAGQVFTTGAMGYLNAIAAAFKQQLYPGLVDLFLPVIVGRVAYQPEPGRSAYRLPVSQTEMGNRWAYVTDASFSREVTTMRSRKAGHGV